MAAPFDARAVRLTGAARLVLAGVATSAHLGVPHLALSREGTLAYVPGDGSLPAHDAGLAGNRRRARSVADRAAALHERGPRA